MRIPRIHSHRAVSLIERLTALPYGTLFVLWIGMIVAFALTYWTLAQHIPAHGLAGLAEESRMRLLDSLYFSVITATTIGYGDIVPLGFAKLLAGTQAVFAYFVFGICIGKLVSNRQEIALREMHRLTAEDVFHNLREGLFIVRKDCDRVIAAARGGTIAERDWEDLATAYRQAQTLLREIPDFYGAENQLYTIDPLREELLQEAVHRTLHRINELLDALSRSGIRWTEHPTAQDMRHLAETVDQTVGAWRAASPHGSKPEAFEDILRLSRKMRDRMASAV